jgi:hypothetical protein
LSIEVFLARNYILGLGLFVVGALLFAVLTDFRHRRAICSKAKLIFLVNNEKSPISDLLDCGLSPKNIFA